MPRLPLIPFSYSQNDQFNHVNSLRLIARAHQLVQEGYKFMFDDALVTVWSAPNYCYRCGNLASILTIGEDGARSFTVYSAAEENNKDEAMANGRKMVSNLDLLSLVSSEYETEAYLVVFSGYRTTCSILYKCIDRWIDDDKEARSAEWPRKR